MHTRAKNSFETLCKYRITVKVLTERRPGFFGMNQADFDTSLYHFCNDTKKRNRRASVLHIQVLDVGRAYPKMVLNFR